MLKVAVTHDVDRIKKTYQYISQIIRGIWTFDYRKVLYQVNSILHKEEPYWNFESLYGVESRFQIRSTFFFLNETLPFNPLKYSSWYLSLGRYNIEDKKVQDIILELDRNNWEVGLHGSFNSYRNHDLLVKEKRQLEKILGHDIIGVRQHHLNLNSDTWLFQKSAGFKYDSSWGHNDQMGFKDQKISPFKPFNDDFVVFPLVIMDKTFFVTKDRWSQFDKLVETSIQNNSILVLNWHLDTFNDKEFPFFKSDFIKIVRILKDKGAEFNTLKNFYLNI